MKPHRFAVHVADLAHPGARRAVRLSGPLPGELAVSGSRLPAGAEIGVDVVLEAVAEGVLATGTVAAPFLADCRRCLRPVEGVLEAAVQELFSRRSVEPDGYPLDHDQVDLEPMVREAVVLALPLAPLCSDECRGLCPRCGADLNEGPCQCVPEPDPRWAALDALRSPEES